MTGEIPPELGRLSNLKVLVLDGNQLTGEIPPELGRLSNLNLLDLYGNQLSGEIPPELGGLSNLTGLFLHGNQLTGCIPEGLRDIAENDLAELNLPDCGAATPGATATPTPTGTAASDRSAMIALYNSMGGPNWKNNANWLSDKPVGDWYGITTDNRGRIIRISLHYNGLNGQIPLQFGDLDALNYLELTGIDGDNPDLSALSDLTNLRYLSLGDNGISDLSALTELPRLTTLILHDNRISDVSPLLSPNPPKDTDGRREGSGRGWVRELQGRWPGVLG